MKRRIKKLLKLYSFEISLFFLLLTGFFLLVVDVDLKENIHDLISLSSSLITEILNIISKNLTGGLKIIKFSNLLGFLILLICFYLTFKRSKSRLIQSNYSHKICEKCNCKLNRISKTKFLKIISFFMQLKIRLYQCDECYQKYKLIRKK